MLVRLKRSSSYYCRNSLATAQTEVRLLRAKAKVLDVVSLLIRGKQAAERGLTSPVRARNSPVRSDHSSQATLHRILPADISTMWEM